MISSSAFTAVSIILIIGMFLPPIAFLLYGLRNKGKSVWSAWFWGALVFLGMHILFKTPILSLYTVFGGGLLQHFYIVYCLILVLIVAGLETLARFVMARMLSRKELTFKRSIAVGMGYEGVEAIVTLGIPYFINMIFMQMISGGVMDEVISAAGEGGALGFAQRRDFLVNTTATEFYLIAYESVITMLIHATLTLFVCHVVWREKKSLAMWGTMAVYAGVDFFAMIVDGMATPYLGSILSEQTSFIIKYSVLTIVAIAAVLYIILIRLSWKPEEEQEENAEPEAKTKELIE